MNVNRLSLILRIYLISVTISGGVTLMAQTQTIKILVTSDVHGQLFPYDFLADQPGGHSLASVHQRVESIRSSGQGDVILLENGDLMQGTPAAFYSAYMAGEGKSLFARVLNYMKYDAMTIGNHDIECGPEVYDRLAADMEMPLLGANVIDVRTGNPYFRPYTVINKSGLKIAVLGLTTTGVPNWLPPALWANMDFQDMVDAAKFWVNKIQEVEQPHAIIGLFHSGLGREDNDPDAFPMENASAHIAKHVPGIDVIFTGHDHGKRNLLIENVAGEEVLILGPRHHAEVLAEATLVFTQRNEEGYKLRVKIGNLLDIDPSEPHEGYVDHFSKDMQDIKKWATQRVGALEEDIYSIESIFGPGALTDLIHLVQLEETGAEISLTAPLSFNDTIGNGTLMVKDFFKLYEYENYLYTMELKGSEILDFLEYSYGGWFNKMESESDHLLSFRKDESGDIDLSRPGSFRLKRPYFSFDSAAGIVYEVDVRKAVGERVSIIQLADGRPFDPDGIYTVAINSYRGSGGGGHLTEGAGISHASLRSRIKKVSDKELRTVLMDYFKEHQSVSIPKVAYWKILPVEWAAKAREHDMEWLMK